MTTNFYKVKPPKHTECDIEDTQDLFEMLMQKLIKYGYLRDNDIDYFNKTLTEYINNKYKLEKIYLGYKKDDEFIWYHNNLDYYDATLESIKEFLDNGEGWIEDEYENKYTTEQFFNEEMRKPILNQLEGYQNVRDYAASVYDECLINNIKSIKD